MGSTPERRDVGGITPTLKKNKKKLKKLLTNE
jgi:hypothetical protein